MIAPVPGGEWMAFGEEAGRYVFVNWLCQSTWLLGAGLGVSRLPRLSAPLRHGLLALSLGAAAVVPLRALVPARTRPTAIAPEHARHLSIRSASHAGTRSSLPVRPFRPSRPSASEAPPAGGELPLGLVLLGIWGAGVAYRLARLGYGLSQVRRWRRSAVQVDRRRIYAACRYVVADMPVLEARCVTVPMAAGIAHPCILLPAGLAESLTKDELRHVLLHEEAHLRRRDPLTLLAAELCHAVLFWHPLAGVVHQEMVAAAEDACDARVLARGIEGRAYARTLLTVLDHVAPHWRSRNVCPLNGGVELTRRVRRIVQGTPPPSPAASVLAGGALAAASWSGCAVLIGTPPDSPRLPLMARTPEAPSAERTIPVRELRSAIRRRLALSAPVRPRLAPAAPRLPRVRPVRVAVGPLPPRGVPRFVAVRPAGAVRSAPEWAEGEAVPAAWVDGARVAPPKGGRYVVIVADLGGMHRARRADATREILQLLGELGPYDRFNLIGAAPGAPRFSESPVAADDETLSAAGEWLDGLPLAGSEDSRPALRLAVSEPDATSLLFLSAEQGKEREQELVRSVALVEGERPCGLGVERRHYRPADLAAGPGVDPETGAAPAKSRPERVPIVAEDEED